MTTRRPLQPLSPLSPNTVGARYSYTRDGSNGVPAMDAQAQDDMQPLGDVESLTSLENDADDFDRLMIQNARDERRLNDALHGRVQPFRKARPHPRVGVTLENLERHNARNNAGGGENARVKFESPASSNGSARSDPALQPPVSWGRKARPKRNWMRTITSEEQQTPGAHEDTIARFDEETPRRADDADVPRQSIEDSPLSRKGSFAGTPAAVRQSRIDDWDFDLNEASLIASTPYIPRNTTLDDIRQREIDSLKEQGVATSRLDKIRETSPEERRRPLSSSSNRAATQSNGTTMFEQAPEQVRQGSGSPERRKRTNSWQTIGKSQAVTSEGGDNSPIVVYKKSSETVGIVDRGLLANAASDSKRPFHKREDSQDLLRRLARVSNTPSPGRIANSRPQTAPAKQPDSSSRSMGSTPITSIVAKGTASEAEPGHSIAVEPAVQPQIAQSATKADAANHPLVSTQEGPSDDDATPIPRDQSMLNPKTPVVTGAWVDTIIDTPQPATVQRPVERSRSPGKSPKQGSPSKKSPKKQSIVPHEEVETKSPDVIRPRLAGSALEAIVGEARANGRRGQDGFGDSTINSLEELLGPIPENPDAGEVDEDTLQGLQIPTGVPRNEAERLRQQELLQLHRMNDRLRAARTNIRDASRGISRVENRVEHVEEIIENGEKVKVIYRDCPCASTGGHQCEESTFWKLFKRLFYDKRLKPTRRGWGLTVLSIILITFFSWLILENTACELWCHHEYASSYKDYGVTWNAPRYPFVIPTVIYRNFIKAWWIPLWSLLVWTWKTAVALFVGAAKANRNDVSGTAAQGMKTRTQIWYNEAGRRVFEDELGGADDIVGFAADELLRRR